MQFEFVLTGDICSNKHGGNVASVLAFERSKPGHRAMYEQLIGLLGRHPSGITTHEIAEILEIPNRNKFAPRISELKAMGVVVETGELRGGCHVLRLK